MSDVTADRRTAGNTAARLAALMSRLAGPADFWDRPDGSWAAPSPPDGPGGRKRPDAADVNSAYRLGSKALRRGDAQAAEQWLGQAAEHGHPGAVFRLAVLTARLGGPELHTEVTQLVAAAAHLGHGDALALREDMAAFPADGQAVEDSEFADELCAALLSGAGGMPGRSVEFSASPLRAPRLTVAARQVPGQGSAPAQWKAVERALRILHVLHGSSVALSPAQLSKRARLSKGVVERLLPWLCQRGMADGLPDGGYAPGPDLLALAQPSGGAAESALQRTLATLRDAVGAAVYVSSYTDGEVHISRLSDGPQAPRVYEWVDFRFAGHASAVGKSLLHQLPFEARMDHLARRHPVRLTPRTITDPARLFRIIDHNGPRSVQFDWQEYSPREVCVAVPLSFGQAEALALSLPASQRHRLKEAAQTLTDQSATVLLSLLLSGNPPVEPASPRQGEIAVVPPTDGLLLARPAAITVRTGPAPSRPEHDVGNPTRPPRPAASGKPALDWSDVVDDLNDHGVPLTPIADTYAAAM
ncbi:IclR family transcriptional regulator C-terminal domain-containing protein [Streptomyces sp. NPDC006463]|uniref:IclR family transcriptional regulator domain-containing protein n=1 Tax=Streptomyces sp. NPDC006463 TaxID=3364746 RepID=UPI0036D09085